MDTKFSDIDKLYLQIDEYVKPYTSIDFIYHENKKNDMAQALIARDKFVSEYSWAIPTRKIIAELKNFIGDEIVLEVGAGKGLWAFLLKNVGVQIIATDKNLTENSWTNILKYDAITAINKFCPNILLIIWPPYNSPMAYDALKKFTGDKVIYIGEGYYGCTGDDNYHQLLTNEWKLSKKLDCPQWTMCTIQDFVSIYIRRVA